MQWNISQVSHAECVGQITVLKINFFCDTLWTQISQRERECECVCECVCMCVCSLYVCCGCVGGCCLCALSLCMCVICVGVVFVCYLCVCVQVCVCKNKNGRLDNNFIQQQAEQVVHFSLTPSLLQLVRCPVWKVHAHNVPDNRNFAVLQQINFEYCSLWCKSLHTVMWGGKEKKGEKK